MKPLHGLLAAALFGAACAQVREPSGGERDARGPLLLEAAPPALTTHFATDRIVLTFDERIRLDRVRERLLISPPLAEPPDVRLSGSRTVVIDLKAPLEPRTTYTFNVGDAIVDLSEGNAAAGLVYVISTGDHIDSLTIAGGVLNAFTGKPEKDVVVMLHPEEADTAFQRGMPLYFTRSGSDGSFDLEHLRPGRYRLFALHDQNSNYRYDLPNEEIAFLAGTVNASASDSSRHTLHLFREAAAEQQVLDARVIPDGALRVVLARPSRSASLSAVDWSGGTLRWIGEVNGERDTLLFWPTDTTLLSGRSFALIVDSIATDTLRYEPSAKMPFDLALTRTSMHTPDGMRLVIIASRPMMRIDTAGIERQGLDTVPLSARLDSLDPRRLLIDLEPQEGDAATLVLLPKAVTDIYGGSHDTLEFAWGASAARETGNLLIRLPEQREGPPGPRVLQLLDAQDRVVREDAFNDERDRVEWRQVPPGSYTLKLISDRDGNGRWSTGSLVSGRAPEQVRRFDGPVVVRAAWEVEVEWKAP
jgi:hypothetical protein